MYTQGRDGMEVGLSGWRGGVVGGEGRGGNLVDGSEGRQGSAV